MVNEIRNQALREAVEELYKTFQSASDAEVKMWMQAYMRHKFEFIGLSAPIRRKIQKPWLLQFAHKTSADEIYDLIHKLFERSEREFQYTAIDLFFKNRKIFRDNQMRTLLESTITTKSWWDTVDVLASGIAGDWLSDKRDLQQEVSDAWIQSDNVWLMRSALIFQLKYRNKTDFDLLCQYILALVGHKDFFIQKAIGWALREYSKTEPHRVHTFVTQHQTALSNLSKREALRWMKRKT